MLKDASSSAIVAVRDVAAARHFYETRLGLEVTDASDEVLTLRTGATRLIVYRSDVAGTNQANAVVWGVGDEIEAIVADLLAQGVTFEHYDMPGTYAYGVHTQGTMKLAWFKDPDGNILHLNNL